MTQRKLASFVSCIAAALLLATPAMGQLVGFPVLALPSGDADGATSVGAAFARGLNDNSGKQNGFAAGVVRAMEMVSFGVSGGYVASDTDELTLGGRVGYHVLSETDAPVQVTVQSGLAWRSLDFSPDDITQLNIPVGVAIQSNSDGPASAWVMPRWNFLRSSSGGSSNTESKFGASAGGSYAMESGAGIFAVLDLQRFETVGGDESALGFGIGLFYALP